MQLNSIEVSIKQAQISIDKMDAFERLTANKDFTNIILKGYFVEEASRSVLSKANPSMQGEIEQKDLENSIIAIGYLKQYFISLVQMGRLSKKAIEDDKLTREEILSGVE